MKAFKGTHAMPGYLESGLFVIKLLILAASLILLRNHPEIMPALHFSILLFWVPRKVHVLYPENLQIETMSKLLALDISSIKSTYISIPFVYVLISLLLVNKLSELAFKMAREDISFNLLDLDCLFK